MADAWRGAGPGRNDVPGPPRHGVAADARVDRAGPARATTRALFGLSTTSFITGRSRCSSRPGRSTRRGRLRPRRRRRAQQASAIARRRRRVGRRGRGARFRRWPRSGLADYQRGQPQTIDLQSAEGLLRRLLPRLGRTPRRPASRVSSPSRERGARASRRRAVPPRQDPGLRRRLAPRPKSVVRLDIGPVDGETYESLMPGGRSTASSNA